MHCRDQLAAKERDVKANILIVDDDEGIRFGFSEYLSKKGYNIEEASSLAEAGEAVSGSHFDILMSEKF